LKTKSLLSHLSELETSLNSFSFEELTAEDAAQLQQFFLSFKNLAEAKIWGEPNPPVHPGTSEAEIQDNAADAFTKELQLIATVSHEIRTPVSDLIDITDSLKDTDLTPEQQYRVEAIESVSKNLLDTINELLEYSRLSAGLVHFEWVPFNLHNLIKEVSYLCKTLILDKSVCLDIHLDPAIPKYLMGDPSGLGQVLLSLLGNAIGIVKNGAVSLHVVLEEHKGDSLRLKFVISDTGIGISETDLEHIFTSFRQAGNATYRKNGGSGLGLGIVKKLVDKLGGNMAVASTLGQGTTFTIMMPFEKASGPAIRPAKAVGRKGHPGELNEVKRPDGAAPVIDLAPLLQDCLGRVEILEDLVVLYRQNALEFIGTVKVCLGSSDFEGIAFAANKINCAIKMFRTENLSFLAEQIHKSSRMEQDILHLKFLHGCFLQEYAVVEAAIEAALIEIRGKKG
jgi:signal transduction histidine kinase